MQEKNLRLNIFFSLLKITQHVLLNRSSWPKLTLTPIKEKQNLTFKTVFLNIP